MGSMTFTRLDPIEGSIFNRFSFDSSPAYSLGTALGFDPNSFKLVQQGPEKNGLVFYEVHGASYPTDSFPEPKPRLRGHLTYETPARRWARMD